MERQRKGASQRLVCVSKVKKKRRRKQAREGLFGLKGYKCTNSGFSPHCISISYALVAMPVPVPSCICGVLTLNQKQVNLSRRSLNP